MEDQGRHTQCLAHNVRHAVIPFTARHRIPRDVELHGGQFSGGGRVLNIDPQTPCGSPRNQEHFETMFFFTISLFRCLIYMRFHFYELRNRIRTRNPFQRLLRIKDMSTIRHDKKKGMLFPSDSLICRIGRNEDAKTGFQFTFHSPHASESRASFYQIRGKRHQLCSFAGKEGPQPTFFLAFHFYTFLRSSCRHNRRRG